MPVKSSGNNVNLRLRGNAADGEVDINEEINGDSTDNNANVSLATLSVGAGLDTIDGGHKMSEFFGYTAPPASYDIEYLVVAGGGGGGSDLGGGGGAGGYLTSTYNSISTGITMTITVGAAGSGSSNTSGRAGSNGGNSIISGTGISTVTSIGGGAGSTGNDPDPNGRSGGSGGGVRSNNTPGAGTPGQGFAGGNATYAHYVSGGGGGASAVGQSTTTNNSGNGGDGKQSSITGTSTYYAGGGGGGGGYSGTTYGSPGQGTIGRGGGGGGVNASSGSGNAGIVILRMPDVSYTGTVTGSPTVTQNVGGTGETVVQFTGSGTYTT